MRDLPAEYIVSDCIYSHLRDEVRGKVNCKCIRCREVGYQEKKGIEVGKPKLKRKDYDASGGKEIFLSYEDEKGTLISLLRLRIPSDSERKEINSKTGLIREIHTYGRMAKLNGEPTWQHKGYGKKLMQEAEKIAKEFNLEKIVVIAGIGVRKYFYKLGYKIEGPHVSKKL